MLCRNCCALGIKYRRDEANGKLVLFVNCWYFTSFLT